MLEANKYLIMIIRLEAAVVHTSRRLELKKLYTHLVIIKENLGFQNFFKNKSILFLHFKLQFAIDKLSENQNLLIK